MLIVAVVVAGLIYVLAGADATPNETADSPLINGAAPDAVGTLDSGGRFDLSRRKGSWVVLNFFQSSCVPCVQEHPELVEFNERQQAMVDDGAELYTVVYDDDRPSVERFFAEEGGDWPIVYDDDGSIAVSFGVSKVPETWIIDPNGIVRERIISRTDRRLPRHRDRPDAGVVSASARLKGWPGWILLAFVVAGLLAVGSTRDNGPQTPDDRVASITKRVACPVCEGESVYESRNTASENIRNAVEERVDAGQMSDDEIIAYVQSRQDASILLVPENSGLDALVWAIPAVAGACAIGGLAMAFRRLARRRARHPGSNRCRSPAGRRGPRRPRPGARPRRRSPTLAPSPTSWDDAPTVDGDARR